MCYFICLKVKFYQQVCETKEVTDWKLIKMELKIETKMWKKKKKYSPQKRGMMIS